MFLVKNIAFYLRPSLRQGFQDGIFGSLRKLSTTSYLLQEETVEDKLVQYGIKDEQTSKAMRAYLERAASYKQFIEQEEKEYKTGKRHLANMMGRDPESFTQDDVDEAIQYLFPSGLYVHKTRPFMKPPKEVHPATKEAAFDETGRPHHYLFYTAKPNLYEFLHNLVEKLKELNTFEDTMIRKQQKPDPALELTFEGHDWLPLEEFEKLFLEHVTREEYQNLINTLDRLASHPYGYRAKDILQSVRTVHQIQVDVNVIPKPQLQADGREFVTFEDSRRKTACANVTVRSPGTGLMTINGQSIEYFNNLLVRQQLLFPLHFTGKLNCVDVEASVSGGGTSGQSGAIRYGISMALRSFVDAEMLEKMRLVGLLTRDRRRKERKKPGQEGARRKFTWKKR